VWGEGVARGGSGPATLPWTPDEGWRGGRIHASMGKFLALESNPGVYSTYILV
jgi:hypothetical protein